MSFMKNRFCCHHDSFFGPWVIQKCPAVEESSVIFQFTGFQPNSMKVRDCILSVFHPLKCVRFPADSGDVLFGDRVEMIVMSVGSRAQMRKSGAA